eukprot:TRINITY_DN45516_c0_g1_i1.p1 TRINITY_DN45516_c0_g1~~TRINITY_DN45516_c0_g1_i1.p1  ORF type:complete len:655 (+),score=30.88 TRINITY_DN45516_c0_g1_i1:94-2058(+)
MLRYSKSVRCPGAVRMILPQKGRDAWCREVIFGASPEARAAALVSLSTPDYHRVHCVEVRPACISHRIFHRVRKVQAGMSLRAKSLCDIYPRLKHIMFPFVQSSASRRAELNYKGQWYVPPLEVIECSHAVPHDVELFSAEQLRVVWAFAIKRDAQAKAQESVVAELHAESDRIIAEQTVRIKSLEDELGQRNEQTSLQTNGECDFTEMKMRAEALEKRMHETLQRLEVKDRLEVALRDAKAEALRSRDEALSARRSSEDLMGTCVRAMYEKLCPSVATTAVAIGAAGEDSVKRWLEKALCPRAAVQVRNRLPGAGDLHVMFLDGTNLMVEVKSKGVVTRDDVDRFESNVSECSDVRGGVFISLRATVPFRERVDVGVVRGKPYIFLSINDDSSAERDVPAVVIMLHQILTRLAGRLVIPGQSRAEEASKPTTVPAWSSAAQIDSLLELHLHLNPLGNRIKRASHLVHNLANVIGNVDGLLSRSDRCMNQVFGHHGLCLPDTEFEVLCILFQKKADASEECQDNKVDTEAALLARLPHVREVKERLELLSSGGRSVWHPKVRAEYAALVAADVAANAAEAWATPKKVLRLLCKLGFSAAHAQDESAVVAAVLGGVPAKEAVLCCMPCQHGNGNGNTSAESVVVDVTPKCESVLQ